MKTIRLALVCLLAAPFVPGCAGEEVIDEVPSPDDLGKADAQAFKLMGTIAYGQTIKGRGDVGTTRRASSRVRTAGRSGR
jgi:hypothetical protein